MTTNSLQELGFKPAFQTQLTLDDMASSYPARVAAVHKNGVTLWHEAGESHLAVALLNKLPPVTVGDWLLIDQAEQRPVRLLERISLVQRKAAGERADMQLMAANLDILLIVSSCNQDFNVARLERYLALAYDAGVMPVIVLTKSDLCDNPDAFADQARSLHAGLLVEVVNALDRDSIASITSLCTPGTTLAMVGSSGVGKSSLANTLGANNLDTGGIREDDSKGRHTTTARSMHRIVNGSLLIDMPGMREIQLAGTQEGIEALFDEWQGLAPCRFKNCTHASEPGCSVLAAVASGDIEQRRLDSYHKLMREQRWHEESVAERHERTRKLGKLYRSVQKHRRD